jgi:TorA maturation chaperone TorD
MRAEGIAEEEQGRANLYALLARLFYAPPDRALLDAIATADEIAAENPGTPLAAAWRRLAAAAAAVDEEAVREEYEGTFIGTGKAEVTLYTSAYTVKTSLDNPLVEIREFLLRHGLVRRENAHEPEDHIAGLCETMRHLIASDGKDAEQRRFFSAFLWPAANSLCDAISRSESINFYKHVGELARSFFQLEHTAFELD